MKAFKGLGSRKTSSSTTSERKTLKQIEEEFESNEGFDPEDGVRKPSTRIRSASIEPVYFTVIIDISVKIFRNQ